MIDAATLAQSGSAVPSTSWASVLIPTLAGLVGASIGALGSIYSTRQSNKYSREREAEERRWREAAQHRAERAQRTENLYLTASAYREQFAAYLSEFRRGYQRGDYKDEEVRWDALSKLKGNRELFAKVQILTGSDLPKASAALERSNAVYGALMQTASQCADGIDDTMVPSIRSATAQYHQSLMELLASIREERSAQIQSVTAAATQPTTG
jgi:hypothetical protein